MPISRKPIFDSVRTILKRGFHQSEVDTIDGAIDRVIARQVEGAPKQSGVSVPRVTRNASRIAVSPRQSPIQVGESGIALIKRFEGCARLRRDGLVEAYPDPGTGGEPWTIGWGATRKGLHGFVGPETVWTQDQCDERLEHDLKRYAEDVARALSGAATTQAQFDALVSFHYNTGAIARASLTKRHVAGDFEGAAAQFARWNKAGGRVLKGLVRRRAAEAELYRS